MAEGVVIRAKSARSPAWLTHAGRDAEFTSKQQFWQQPLVPRGESVRMG